MKHAKGIMWLDDCRIPFVDDGDMKATTNAKYTIGEGKQSELGFGTKKIGNVSVEKGRFTPNLLVCDDMLNDGSVSRSIKGGKGKALPNSDGKNDGIRMRPETILERGGFDDKGTNSRYYDLDLWFDKMLEKL